MKDLKNLSLKLQNNTFPQLVCIILAASLVSACSDEGVLTGGSSGDTTENASVQAASALIQPFVGVYQLQDNWNGTTGDLAYLSIRLTGNDGTSEAALIDFDDANNCIPNRPTIGEVRKDPFFDRVFLDDISQFSEAVLSLNGNELSIEAIDFFDIDDDSNNTETVTIEATRLGLTEVDLGTPC